MKVTIIKSAVQSGEHYGKKGQVVDVPDAVAKQWIAIGAATPAAEEKPGKK